MRGIELLPLLAATVNALSSADWRSQSIYQVITDRFALTNGSTTAGCSLGDYCGGTWQGITNRLDYIQAMGFTAIWISPIVKNLEDETEYGRPYHGYWAQDIYSLNSNFGTADDLKALSTALHNRGMYLMVDVVTNHMAYNGAPSSVDYSDFNPFDSADYFHPYCAIDYSNTTSTQHCWMGDEVVSLPDLRTEDSNVQDIFNTWISELVSNYSIDGLRIDSAQQVDQEFFPSFVSAAGVYAVGEVLNGAPSTLCPYQDYMPGMLNYAAYFWVQQGFEATNGTLENLASGLEWMISACKDVTLLANFMENHDQPRFPSLTSDKTLIQNAIAFTMMNDGIPIIYYGQEQDFSGASDPNNRQPFWPAAYDTGTTNYHLITKLNSIRSAAIKVDPTYVTTTSNILYSDTRSIVLGKGASGTNTTLIASNYGAGVNETLTLSSSSTGWTKGTSFADLLSCDVLTTDDSGNLEVTIIDGAPRVLYPTSGLSSLGLCTSTGSVSSTSSSIKVSSIQTTAPTASSVKTTSAASSSFATAMLPSSSVNTSILVASSVKTNAARSSSVKTSTTASSSFASAATASSGVRTSTTITSSSVGTNAAPSVSAKTIATSSSSVSTTACEFAAVDASRLKTVSTASSGVETKAATSSSSSAALSSSAIKTTLTVKSTSTFCSSSSALGHFQPKAASSASSSRSSSSTTGIPAFKAAIASPSHSFTASSFTTTHCSLATSIAVSFFETKTTTWGETVKLSGSIWQLGRWKPQHAVALSASGYNASDPVWNVTVPLPAGVTFEYKFILVDQNGAVSWESDPNRQYAVPKSCLKTAVVSDAWR